MIEIITNTRLAYSPAFIFVMENFVKILKEDHSEHSLCIDNSMMVTYAVDQSVIVGACVYELNRVKNQAWIYTAGVKEEYQRKGIYDIIYKEVESVCKAEGMVALNSNIHVDNIGMIRSAAKNNRKLSYYRSTKLL
jgi:hypothetical protein